MKVRFLEGAEELANQLPDFHLLQNLCIVLLMKISRIINRQNIEM